ncbi:ROK family protein [Neptunicella marina]|uniref:N-acetylglucosamine kinase n=1 Tax=Neptunicella marina TaxID=2125989 RepID=A0A8J6IVS8_9ALTE|nr:ROK family protein [Neptunicella marina]MBC3766378.1 ROK family protein [Neptunicella marina]
MLCGIDIGGTKIETAVFNDDLSPVETWRVDTPTRDYPSFLSCIRQQIAKADTIAGSPCSVGIGLPGLRDVEGRTLSVNVPCANQQQVEQDLSHLLTRNVYIENDCRCFALSEARFGAGQGYTRVYGAILGTGAAGGFCVDGKLNSGQNHIVGEYGHIPIPAQLAMQYQLPVLPCGCGLSGCLEQYISGKGLIFLHQHVSGESLSTREIVDKIRENNTDAIKTFAIFMDLLGFAMATIVHSYDPDVIVLGGGLSNVAEIIDSLPQAVQRFTFPIVVLPRIVKATHGDSSGVRGAALLAV